VRKSAPCIFLNFAARGHLRLRCWPRTRESDAPPRGPVLSRALGLWPPPIPQTQAPEREPRDRQQQARLHQIRIEGAHASRVLSVTIFNEPVETEAVQEHVGLRHGEFLTIVCALAPSDHLEESGGKTHALAPDDTLLEWQEIRHERGRINRAPGLPLASVPFVGSRVTDRSCRGCRSDKPAERRPRRQPPCRRRSGARLSQ
jgi:hypothetical protein